MKTRNLAVLLLALINTACDQSDSAASPDKESKLTTISLTVDGRARSLLVYQPKGHNNAGKLPLLFVNHGGQGTSEGMLAVTDFRLLADQEKFLVIYPQGFEKTWNDGRPTTANQLGVDDINFFRKAIDYAVAELSADLTRVYVTGLSNGGFMAARLGCELSDRVAAIAVVGASIEQNVFNRCNPTRAVAAMFIQGTIDPFVPFNGGIVLPGAGGTAVAHHQTIAKWVTLTNSNPTPIVTPLPDAANDGTTITKSIFRNTNTSVEVASYVVNNGGHTWPLGLQYLPVSVIGKTTQNLNGNEVIWQFCSRYKRD